MYLKCLAQFRAETNSLRKVFQFSFKQRGFFQIPPTSIHEVGLHPLHPSFPFKAFQYSKNWPSSGKFYGLLFFVYLVSKWWKISEKSPFCTFGKNQWLCLNHWFGNSLKNLTFKINKKQNFEILYLKFYAEVKHTEEFNSLFFETSWFFATSNYIDPWQRTLPPTNILLFKDFNISKNWQCCGKNFVWFF